MTELSAADREVLEEERDALLASLADLDEERAAGNLSDEDFATLHADYTRRSATVIRRLSGEPAAAPAPSSGRAKSTVLTLAVVVVVAALSGWLLARSVGSRGPGDSLTGQINAPRSAESGCQMQSFQDPPKGIACYDKLLATQPDNVPALTYRGWAKIRTKDVDAGRADLDRVLQLDPKYPDQYVFRAVMLKNAKDFAGAQQQLDTLYGLNPSADLISTMENMGLPTEVAFGALEPDVGQCWMAAKQYLKDLDATSTTVAPGATPAGFADRLSCFDGILTQRPNSLDALRTRAAFVFEARSRDHAPSALANLDHVLTLAPADPSGLLLRSVLRLGTGDAAGAVEDLTTLQDSGKRPSALFGPEADELQAALSRSAGSTTTSVPGSS
jgi:tetratricopeptide (TPR) repeat protein